MIRLVNAEILKLRTIRTTWVLLLVAVGLVGLIAVLFVVHSVDALSGSGIPAFGSHAWARLILGLSGSGEDFALLVGILCVTSEYRHGTITPSLLAEPRRGRLVAAKLVVSLIAGFVFAFVLLVVVLAVGIPISAAHQVGASVILDQLPKVAPGVLLATALYGLYGAGVGALVKNQIVAVASALAFSLVGEGILTLLAPEVGRWLPDNAAAALTQSTPESTLGRLHLLPWWEGALVMLGYGVVSAVVGVFTTVRGDVT